MFGHRTLEPLQCDKSPTSELDVRGSELVVIRSGVQMRRIKLTSLGVENGGKQVKQAFSMEKDT